LLGQKNHSFYHLCAQRLGRGTTRGEGRRVATGRNKLCGDGGTPAPGRAPSVRTKQTYMRKCPHTCTSFRGGDGGHMALFGPGFMVVLARKVLEPAALP
jgi:hypothetical protein